MVFPLFTRVSINSTDDRAIELVNILFAGSSEEAIAQASGDGAPAIVLIFFEGLTEMVDLQKRKVSGCSIFLLKFRLEPAEPHLVFSQTPRPSLRLSAMSNLQNA